MEGIWDMKKAKQVPNVVATGHKDHWAHRNGGKEETGVKTSEEGDSTEGDTPLLTDAYPSLQAAALKTTARRLLSSDAWTSREPGRRGGDQRQGGTFACATREKANGVGRKARECKRQQYSQCTSLGGKRERETDSGQLYRGKHASA